jgi:ABC-type multidrug transport system ATPase subunit
MSESIVHARGLCKRYGDRQVVRGVDVDVRPGEIFALLGPNGAG